MENAKSIIKWQYWLYNHADPKETLITVFGEWLGNHFYGKFNAKCKTFNENTFVAWVDLFMEMSMDNQAKLAEWVCENYHGVDNLLKQLEG